MHNSCMNQDKYDDLLLDRFDISLLGALQKDAHATNQQVGEQIHLSASQVSRRIQRLETSGIIRRYVALLDPAALGLGVRAMSYVTLSRHGGDEGSAFEREMVSATIRRHFCRFFGSAKRECSESKLVRTTRLKPRARLWPQAARSIGALTAVAARNN